MFSACQSDIALVIDDSGSIRDTGQGNWGKVLDFIKGTIYGLPIGPNQTQLAAVTFSDEGQLQWDLDDYMSNDDLSDAVDKIKYIGGATNTTGKMFLPSLVFIFILMNLHLNLRSVHSISMLTS